MGATALVDRPFGRRRRQIVQDRKQPINTQRQAFGNVAKPDFGPNWQLRFRVYFLFPQ